MQKIILACVSILVLACDADDNPGTNERDAVPPAQIHKYSLGLNYNNNVANFDTVDIDRIYADAVLPRWARFIFNIFPAYNAWDTKGDWLAGKAWIEKYCAAHYAGVKTVLNLRWEFRQCANLDLDPGEECVDRLVPFVNSTCKAQGTCPVYARYVKFLQEEFLPAIEACTNVLVIGNEPFLETDEVIKPNSNFTRFYKNIAQDALEVWPWDVIPFYFGSFEALWLRNDPDKDEARKELLEFVNNEDHISGVDLHMHTRELDQIDKAFEWLNQHLVNGKEVIITEFSPAPAFKDDMGEYLGAAFKAKWGELDPNIKNKERNSDYLLYAIDHARTPAEFREWISILPFSKATPHYLCDAWKMFRSHGRFRLAFQGARQDTPANYDGKKWPWILNPILMPVTQELVNGQPSVRWNWYNDVQKILKEVPCP